MSSKRGEQKAHLPNNFLENNPQLPDAFRYMYPPVNRWMQIAIMVGGSFATWRAIRLYLGIRAVPPLVDVAGPAVAQGRDRRDADASRHVGEPELPGSSGTSQTLAAALVSWRSSSGGRRK